MNKKFLSLVLALVMVLGTFSSVFAAEATTKDAKAEETKKEETKKVPEIKDNNEKVQWLIDNGVVNGRKANKDEKDTDLALDKNIQRAEITKLLVYAIGRQDLATKIQGQVKPYSDVANDHWANGYITVGTTMASPKNALPFLHGYVDGSFKPENDVTYVELAKMLVVLTKDDLTEKDFKTAVWPRDWMAWAAQLGILDGVKVEDSAKAAVRKDAFVMLFNALYKLEDLVAYPSTETMGIISEANSEKLVLNQGDFKKEFKVNASTNFVPKEYKGEASEIINWNGVVKNNTEDYYIGSLVRVLADKDGNVTHIVQLGNPTSLAIESRGWRAVAHDVASTWDKVDVASTKVITLNKVDYKLTDDTRYFVADVKNGYYSEVKDHAALLDLFDRGNFVTEKGVYVGYDLLENSGVKEAKVVVIHDADEDMYGSDTVRIVTPGTINYTLEAQKSGKTATDVEKFDLKDYKKDFPLNYDFDKLDVVDLGTKTGKVLINFSEDNVYEITDVIKNKVGDATLSGSRVYTLELKDKNKDKGKVDILADADLFFGDELKVGKKVQVQFVDGEKNLVDIVSVLPEKEAKDTDLRGFLPESVTNVENEEQIKAEFVSYRKAGDAFEITVKEINNDSVSQSTTTYKTVGVKGADLKALLPGQIITFNKVLDPDGGVITQVTEVKLSTDKDDKKVNDKLAAENDAKDFGAFLDEKTTDGKAYKNLPNISAADRDQLKKDAEAATTPEEVKDIKDNATALDKNLPLVTDLDFTTASLDKTDANAKTLAEKIAFTDDVSVKDAKVSADKTTVTVTLEKGNQTVSTDVAAN